MISIRPIARTFAPVAVLAATAASLCAAPTITRLNPPSALFSFGDPTPPFVARFLPGQRFDFSATIAPDSGKTIKSVVFAVDGVTVFRPVATSPANAAGQPAGAVAATLRAFSHSRPGVHTFRCTAVQDDGSEVTATGNFEIVDIGRRDDNDRDWRDDDDDQAKNVIILIGDGLGASHRTAARIMRSGVQQGKSLQPLNMDTFPHVGLVQTASLNSIITDSSPGAACYATGNKSNNNQQGVFPDDTQSNFDNPRVELIGEYFARTDGRALGIVTTSDVFDATPGSFGTHTQNRGAGTGICDQYLDEAVPKANLRVLLGGGRKWFLPNTTPGSARGNSTDYVLPPDLVSGWNVAPGVLDPGRDLISDFQGAGFAYAPDKTSLLAAAPGANRLLGLFALSNMNVAMDKIDGRRGASTVVNDFGFPDQPMLDEMTNAALTVLAKQSRGFVLMVEGASIDKQAHNMDTERWILDTLEFDRAVGVAKAFAQKRRDTLVVVTADHECAGVAIIGASRVSDADLATRAASGGGAPTLRNPVVGTYEAAGFPMYSIAADGYPVTTNIDNRMLIGYAANADRYEDWRTNPLPINDGQQPFNNVPPLSTHPQIPPAGTGTRPIRDQNGAFLVTGQVADAVAAHTGGDIPLSAFGRGSELFSGCYDNTEVFFKIIKAAVGR
jgi:alkaline phosphatase